jgi:ribonuclease Z
VLGLVGLISTLNLLGRKAPLTIWAHAPLQPILDQNLKFFVNELKFSIVFKALDTKNRKVIFEDKTLTIESIPLKHRIPSTGFIFKEKPKQPNIRKELIDKYSIPLADIIRIKEGADFVTPQGQIIPNSELTHVSSPPRSYAYCSDTKYFDGLAEMVQGVDLLYHEATFSKDLTKMARSTGHSTAEQAAKIAELAKVKRLIIGHFSSRYKDVDVLVNEARKIFTETYAAEEGLEFKIKSHREDI